LVFGYFAEVFYFRKYFDRRKALICNIGKLVLGCFFGLGFVLFAG
jgi:hypothetical protein